MILPIGIALPLVKASDIYDIYFIFASNMCFKENLELSPNNLLPRIFKRLKKEAI